MPDYGFGTFASIGEYGFGAGVDWAEMNKGITPIFMKIPEQNLAKTEAEGRVVYDDIEVVHLHIAGDSNSVHSAPVDETIKQRFATQYAHWKQTEEARMVTGTPLKMWPMATPGFVKEMEAIDVYSVDDLANIADVHIGKFPDGRVWRDRAVAWLKAADGAAAETKFAAENERLRARLDTLEKNFSSLAEAKPLKPKTSVQSERMKLVWAKRREKAAAAS